MSSPQKGGDDFPAELRAWNPARFKDPADWKPRRRPPFEVRGSDDERKLYRTLMESNTPLGAGKRRKRRKGARRPNIRWSAVTTYHRDGSVIFEPMSQLARILWLDRPLLDVERDGIRAKPGKRQSGGRQLLGLLLALNHDVNVKALAESSGINRNSLIRWRNKSATHSRPTKVEGHATDRFRTVGEAGADAHCDQIRDA